MRLKLYEQKIRSIRQMAQSPEVGIQVEAIREIGQKRLPLKDVLLEKLQSDCHWRVHTEAATSLERVFPREMNSNLKRAVSALDLDKELRAGLMQNISDKLWLSIADPRVRRALRERAGFFKEIYEKFHRLAGEIGWSRALTNRYANVLVPLVDIADRSGYTTYPHSLRAMKYAEIIARERQGEGKESVMLLGVLLHDIGKAAVPSAVLRSGVHKKHETAITNRHPVHGRDILEAVFAAYGGLGKHEQKTILDMALAHHVYVGGGGYPKGITELSEGARIATIADAFDAMTAYRVYKEFRTFEEAIGAIKAGISVQFNAGIGKSFLNALKKTENMERAFQIIREGKGNP